MISVVIPTCNRPDQLARCLDRLAPGVQTLSADQYEVIISDDGNPSVEQLLSEKYPWVIWTSGPKRGPAANRNAGVMRAQGDWLAFTDDDCIPGPNWLGGFAAAMHAGCSVYEGKTTCMAGIHSPLDRAPLNLTGGCLWSCNIFIHRGKFEEIGGFDEKFPYPHLEDADLRERLVHAGCLFEFVPGASVDHPPRRSASGSQLARYHESWVYHWYKRGYKKLATPRLLNIILRDRLGTLRGHSLNGDTFRALFSLAVEVSKVIPRLPFWEWKYRRQFHNRLSP